MAVGAMDGKGQTLGPVSHVLQFFAYQHLPAHLQAISKPCADLAHEMVETVPNGPELTVGLRKLLEAKDAFVRANLANKGE